MAALASWSSVPGELPVSNREAVAQNGDLGSHRRPLAGRALQLDERGFAGLHAHRASRKPLAGKLG